MALQFSVAQRNARLEAIRTLVGTTSRLRIWTGGVPANTGAAATGTLLVDVVLAAGYNAASGGSMTLGGLPIATTAVNAGTMGYYRITDNAGTTVHEQGTVTATGGGGDITVDNSVLSAGQAVNVTSFIKTEPGA